MSAVAAGCLGQFLLLAVFMTRKTPLPAAAVLRVLSIEDDAGIGQFLQAVLSANGFLVDVAPDGKEGLTRAQRSQPDLIILDLLMPYKTGFEVLQELRNDPATRSVPVIILSSNNREEDVVKALNAGANDFIIKPFRARELVARVRKVLGQARVVS
jgi:two-component system response regulator MprA